MVTAHTTKAILARGLKHGGKGMAMAVPLAVTVWLAVGQRMEQQDALIRAQTAEIAKLDAKLDAVDDLARDQDVFAERLGRIETDVRDLAAAVYGQAIRDQAQWRAGHCAWLRKEGLDAPPGICDASEHAEQRTSKPIPSPPREARRAGAGRSR